MWSDAYGCSCSPHFPRYPHAVYLRDPDTQSWGFGSPFLSLLEMYEPKHTLANPWGAFPSRAPAGAWQETDEAQLEIKSGKINEVSQPGWLSSCVAQQGGFWAVAAMWRLKCAITWISMLQVQEEQLTTVMLQSAGKPLYLRQTQTATLWMLPLPHYSPVLPDSCPSTCGT